MEYHPNTDWVGNTWLTACQRIQSERRTLLAAVLVEFVVNDNLAAFLGIHQLERVDDRHFSPILGTK